MSDIKINLTNTRCKLFGDIKAANKLRNALRFRHPNQWFLRKHMPKGWDGYIYDISENWTLKVGIIPKLIDKMEEFGITWEIMDQREPVEYIGIKRKLTKKFILRDYQEEAIKAVLGNELPDGTNFPIGVLNAATNAGKTIITAGIHKAFKNPSTLVLLNSSDLFTQGLKEYPELLPGVDIGFIQGKKHNHWGDFTVAMVQTLSKNMRYFSRQLANVSIVIVDECDLADNKTYRNVLNKLFNTTVRVGLSGSIYLSKLKKHQMKNNNLMSFFGKELFTITKTEMVKMGLSSDLVIKVNLGGDGERSKGDYMGEYDRIIINNEKREAILRNRLDFNIKRGRIPLLIVCKFHNHVDRIYKVVNDFLGTKFVISYVHHKVKEREKIIKAFKDGQVDILIASMIIKRGQNLPLIRCLINVAGGDSEENVIQIMGRAERIHESKSKTYIEDFADQGHFLKRHSKHRINYYKKQGFKVIMLDGAKENLQ